MQAPADSTKWHIKGTDMMAWQNGTQWVSWQKKDDQLRRVTGDFDTRTQTWHKKVTSVVAPHITQFSITPKISNKQIQRVAIHISSPTQTIQRVGLIRNGSII